MLNIIELCITVICSRLSNLISTTTIGVDLLKPGYVVRTWFILIQIKLLINYGERLKVLAQTKMYSSVFFAIPAFQTSSKSVLASNRNMVSLYARLSPENSLENPKELS